MSVKPIGVRFAIKLVNGVVELTFETLGGPFVLGLTIESASALGSRLLLAAATLIGDPKQTEIKVGAGALEVSKWMAAPMMDRNYVGILTDLITGGTIPLTFSLDSARDLVKGLEQSIALAEAAVASKQ